jgi:hypothetical protein
MANFGYSSNAFEWGISADTHLSAADSTDKISSRPSMQDFSAARTERVKEGCTYCSRRPTGTCLVCQHSIELSWNYRMTCSNETDVGD